MAWRRGLGVWRISWRNIVALIQYWRGCGVMAAGALVANGIRRSQWPMASANGHGWRYLISARLAGGTGVTDSRICSGLFVASWQLIENGIILAATVSGYGLWPPVSYKSVFNAYSARDYGGIVRMCQCNLFNGLWQCAS